MSAIDDCFASSAKYSAEFTKGSLTAHPAMRVAIVACMDARIGPSALLGIGEGDAHVIRNAGGIVTDDVIRSLMLSQRLLGTREIMLIQHTECGLLGLDEADLNEAIETETGARPGFEIGAFADVDSAVRRSIARIRSSPFLLHNEAIRGFVYDVRTGRLREAK